MRGDFLDGSHGITGAVAGRRRTEDFHRRHAVIARQLGRAVSPLATGEGAERHHAALVVAHIPLVQVFRGHACVGHALQVDLLHSTAVDEVVDVTGTPGDRQGAVDVRQREAEGAGALVVDQQLVLRFVTQAVGAHAVEYRVLVGQLQELVACLVHHLVTDAGLVLQEEVETGGVTHLHHRRRGKGEHHRITEAEEVHLRPLRQCPYAIFLTRTFAPGLEHDEGHTGALTAAGEVEAGDGEHRLNRAGFLFQQVLAHLVDHHLGALGTGAGRRLHLGEEHALVFLGEEGGGNAGEHPGHDRDDHQVQNQVRCLALEHARHAALIGIAAAVEGTVEPAEEAALGLVVVAVDGFEQGSAQRRREDQRHQHRQGHGRDDGDGELPVDDPGGAAEEGHRQEHRRQHQADTHQRALNLPHGFLGRFLG